MCKVTGNTFCTWELQWSTIFHASYSQLHSYLLHSQHVLKEQIYFTKSLKTTDSYTFNIITNECVFTSQHTCNCSLSSFLIDSISGLITGFSFSGRHLNMVTAPAKAAWVLQTSRTTVISGRTVPSYLISQSLFTFTLPLLFYCYETQHLWSLLMCPTLSHNSPVIQIILSSQVFSLTHSTLTLL